ncbi:MAG: IclR family transcriptional regulator [Albidovulum sp.]
MNPLKSDDVDQRYRAPALDKGLDIIELLANQPAGMTRGEIVKAMGRGPSEIYRMIERLVARDYISRSSEGDRYALTMKLFHLGSTYPPIRRLIAQAQPLMNDFANTCQQSVHLVVPDLGQTYVVAQASSRSPWEFRLRIGAELDLLTTSSGQTLLAFQDEAQAAQMLNLRGETQRAISAELSRELARIRTDGHRISSSQQLVGVTDISVPVRSPSGSASAVLTCPYLPHVDADAKGLASMSVKAALQLLLHAAERISIS